MEPSEQQSYDAERHTESLVETAPAPPSEDEAQSTAASLLEEPPTPAPVKRGRPKGSKDAQPRTRSKPVHTPSKQYVDEHDTVHPPNSAAPLQYFEEAMEHARQQEMTRRQTLYTSWLPY